MYPGTPKVDNSICDGEFIKVYKVPGYIPGYHLDVLGILGYAPGYDMFFLFYSSMYRIPPGCVDHTKLRTRVPPRVDSLPNIPSKQSAPFC